MDDQMKAFAKIRVIKFMILAVVLAFNFMATRSYGQESNARLLEDAKAAFGIVSAPAQEELDKPMVELGHRLFWDERLSANGKVACASCHAASAWGADAEQYSLDAKGKLTKRNSQTVFNAMLQPGLRWTADRKSGTHQAERSLTGSMGFAQAEDVIPMLKKHGYEPLFQVAFPNEETQVTPANYAKAIEAYEATLTTPAAFDRYLVGEDEALSAEQKEGLRLFMTIGCADCHSGKLLGGEGLEKFGVHADYWTLTKSQVHDEGLFESTKKDEDKFSFRVSMLRNVEKTAPYFHDGSVGDLKEAIQIMAKLQLDLSPNPKECDAIASFLTSLTGQVPVNYGKPSNPMTTTMNKQKFAGQIEQFGSMHETIGMQQHQGRVKLEEISKRSSFYGVGALERLQGEVTIVDSQPFVSTVTADGQPKTLNEDANDLQATLLVGAEVSEWASIEIPSSMASDKLETWIQMQAERLGLKAGNPFPFLIEGEISDSRLHIINGACPVHAKRQNKSIPADSKPFEVVMKSVQAKVVGVFAKNAAGKLTHPGTSMHAHIVYQDSAGVFLTGHLESFGVQSGAILKLPKL